MLAALAPFQTRAAVNTWNNGSADFLWNTTSLNWAAPTTWTQGDDAIFGVPGAGTVTLGGAITVGNMTFNASYTMNAAVNFMTNSAASVITAAAGTSNNLALSIYGTGSLAYQGSGTNLLLGDSAAGDANRYTGGTFVNGGTLILRAVGVANGGPNFAIGNVQAIDAGAVVQIGTLNNGAVNTIPANGQIQHGSGARLILTGGTLDENGNNNNHNYPPFEGSGTIVNSSPYIRAVHKISGGTGTALTGTPYIFSGQIKDGGPNVTTSQGVAHQMNVDLNGGPYAPMVWSGSNSFTGFIRFNSGSYGNMIKLLPGGTLGYPPSINQPGRHILMNSGCIDLNGTSQKVGYVFTGNNADSIITNSAIGTVSTLTIGFNTTNLVAFNGAATPRGIRNGLRDDPTVAGTLALTKEGVGIHPSGTDAADNNTGPNAQCNYRGDTTVNNGILEVLSTTGISANSAYRLNGPGVLQLDYAGTANVKQLYVNGVVKSPGTYGAVDFPGIITGPGTLTVGANIWTGATDALWNLTSADWTSPTIWGQGANATFTAAGPLDITLAANIDVPQMDFTAANHTITAAGFFITNSVITAAAGTSNNLALSMWGTGGLIFKGTGTTRLAGDASVNDANHYTGGTYIKSGTVILQAAGATTSIASGSSHAVDSIEELATGATLVIPGLWNGVSASSSLRDQVAATATSKMNMTGGTLDFYNDQKNQRIPVPQGTGTILNSGPNTQSGVQALIGNADVTFAGVIKDGNNGVLATNNNFNSGPGYQIGIVQLNSGLGGASGGTWILSGSNTYSGSTRIDNGPGGIRLAGNGTIGFPTPNGLTGPLRIIGTGFLDLNGRNQTLALMTGGNVTGRIINSGVGTVSTLTVGYGMEQANRNAPYIMRDNDGVGGILAFKKINSTPYLDAAGTTLVTNCVQGLNSTCVATYSGDTSIEGGTLNVQGPSAISPNSAYRLSTGNYSLLALSYAGNANVRQLWINGVQQPNGVYGAATAGIHPASPGTITVTGFAPATLGVSQSGSNLNFSWAGVYKLQSSTNNVLGPYSDYVGAGLNAATVPINPNIGAVYFRLATY